MESKKLEDIKKHQHFRLDEEYRLHNVLEDRNMSIWVKATQISTNLPRLIEILNLDSQTDRLYSVEAFLRKSMTLRQMQNRNNLQVLDVGFNLNDSKSFIVFPYYPSLRMMIDEKKQPINFKALIRDVKAALLHARDEYGVSHGNLRPEVIFYDEIENKFIVSDFGIPCKILDKNQSKNERILDLLMGFQKEHPPFELKGLADVNEKGLNVGAIDVFSLGIVLLECFGLHQEDYSALKEFNHIKKYSIYLDGLIKQIKSPLKDEAFSEMLRSMLDPDPNKRASLEEIRISSNDQQSNVLRSNVSYAQSDQISHQRNEYISTAKETVSTIPARSNRIDIMMTSFQQKPMAAAFQNEKPTEFGKLTLGDISMTSSEIYSPTKTAMSLNTPSFGGSRQHDISMTTSVYGKPQHIPLAEEDSRNSKIDEIRPKESHYGISEKRPEPSSRDFLIVSESSSEKYLKKTDFSTDKTSIFVGWGSK